MCIAAPNIAGCSLSARVIEVVPHRWPPTIRKPGSIPAAAAGMRASIRDERPARLADDSRNRGSRSLASPVRRPSAIPAGAPDLALVVAWCPGLMP